MKYVFGFIIFSMLIFGCSKKTDQPAPVTAASFAFDSTDIKTIPVSNPNESFSIRYNFEKGKDYNYRLTSLSDDNQTIKADTTILQHVTQNVTYLLTLTLSNVDKDSVMEMSCNVTSIKLDANANGKKISYQSGLVKDSAEKAQFSEYEALIQNPFSIRITRYGEILEVFRADKIVTKFLELKGAPSTITADEKDALRKNIIEGALKPLLVQIFRQMPQNQVAKDSSWSFSQPPSQFLIYQLQNINDYKVLSLNKYNNDKLAVLDAGLKSIITGKDDFSNRGVNYKFKKPETSATGKIYFNLNKGCIQKSKTNTVVNIFYTMEMTGPKGKEKGSKTEVIKSSNIVELL
ncbi:MAG: DUF6263 family protein [Ignavibacteriaceae bacterium]